VDDSRIYCDRVNDGCRKAGCDLGSKRVVRRKERGSKEMNVDYLNISESIDCC
jgi:hypothetical protein